MKRIQERTLLGCAAVLVLLVGFGAWKLLQVHNAQNSVNALQTNIDTLNAQVPKYDLVVTANDAYTSALARRAAVLNAAVDWPVALNSLIAITPAKAGVYTFTGSQNVVTAGAATAGTAAAPQSAAVGSIDLSVQGPGPRLAISEAWINAVSTSAYFANPLQGSTTGNADGSITFPFAVSVTPAASLSKNASLK
jgi:hypothetical protein